MKLAALLLVTACTKAQPESKAHEQREAVPAPSPHVQPVPAVLADAALPPTTRATPKAARVAERFADMESVVDLNLFLPHRTHPLLLPQGASKRWTSPFTGAHLEHAEKRSACCEMGAPNSWLDRDAEVFWVDVFSASVRDQTHIWYGPFGFRTGRDGAPTGVLLSELEHPLPTYGPAVTNAEPSPNTLWMDHEVGSWSVLAACVARDLEEHPETNARLLLRLTVEKRVVKAVEATASPGHEDYETCARVGATAQKLSVADGVVWYPIGGATPPQVKPFPQTKVELEEAMGDFNGPSRDEIDHVVKGRVGVYRACYLKELKRSPGLAGRLVIRFEIAKDGSVKSSAKQSGDLRNEGLESCMNSNIMRLTFPAKNGASVNYPFVFSQ